MRFLDFLFPPRADEQAIRDVSVDDLLTLLAPQLVPYTRPSTVALLPFFDQRVRAALHEAKYHGSEHAFSLLSAVLLDYLRDVDDVGFHTPKLCLVPVPLGNERRKKRGWNQVEEITKRIVAELESTIDTTLLVRTRETLSQVSLPRDRREENMRGAFKATRPADPLYTYVLIDDVLTTGATLQAAIHALQSAGATHIIPLALAH